MQLSILSSMKQDLFLGILALPGIRSLEFKQCVQNSSGVSNRAFGQWYWFV